MRIASFTMALPALAAMTGFLLAPATALAERSACAGIPPEGPAVCFIEEPFFGVFFESPAAEPEEMVLVLINDPTDDFVLGFPDGRLFVHTPEREGDLIWCPFPFSEFDFDNPDDRCVFGTAKLQANGYIEPNGDLSCPYTSHLTGSGLRGSHGVAFNISADMLRVPTIQDQSGCRIVKDDISAEPAQ
jgi:hypothetical protein